MASYQQQFIISDGMYIEVTHDTTSAAWSTQMTLQLFLENSKMQVAQLLLRSLEPLSYSGFIQNDFVQHGLKSIEPGKGYAHRLHDFLIDYRQRLPFEIHNVYSTNPNVDNLYFVQPNHPRLYLSESAIRFWDKRIRQNKAEFLEDIKRYKIKWD